MVEFLDWDSDFFKLRIGKTEVCSQYDMEYLFYQQNDLKFFYDLIYVFSTKDLVAHMNNCSLVDQKLIFKKHIEPFSYQSDEHVIEYLSNIVSNDLLKLALASGEYSRFKLDKNLPDNAYERLYTRWIEQSVNHINATEVFCYIINNTPIGLISLKRDEISRKGTIGLVATDKSNRGRGIGSTLLKNVMYFCSQKAIQEISVATQKQNLPACRLYEKMGFSESSCTNIYHWWLK